MAATDRRTLIVLEVASDTLRQEVDRGTQDPERLHVVMEIVGALLSRERNRLLTAADDDTT